VSVVPFRAAIPGGPHEAGPPFRTWQFVEGSPRGPAIDRVLAAIDPHGEIVDLAAGYLKGEVSFEELGGAIMDRLRRDLPDDEADRVVKLALEYAGLVKLAALLVRRALIKASLRAKGQTEEERRRFFSLRESIEQWYGLRSRRIGPSPRPLESRTRSRPRSPRRTGLRVIRPGPDDDSEPRGVAPSPPGGGRLGVHRRAS
jgi:hypothetical protein